MKKFETGKEKIQKICDLIRRETLEPAEEKAGSIVVAAEAEAERIIADAKREAERLERVAHERIEKERAVFYSSMKQGARQSVELLRQEVEEQLFDKELGKMVAEASGDPQLIANLVGAIVGALDREGTATNLEVLVPDPAAVSSLLLERVRGLLKEGVSFKGGMRAQLRDQNLTIDISDVALVELLGRYVRKDYRELLFGE